MAALAGESHAHAHGLSTFCVSAGLFGGALTGRSFCSSFNWGPLLIWQQIELGQGQAVINLWRHLYGVAKP